MRIRLLAFASAGDALGTGELDLELPAGASLADLRRLLDSRYPGLAPIWTRLAVAIDGAIAGPDALLADGAEVALLPPVSGGAAESAGPSASPDRPMPRPRAELVEGPIDPQEVIARVAAASRGAVVLFLGTVRDRPRQPRTDAAPPRRVLKLTYSAYRPMALEALRRIVADLEKADPGLQAAIVHRLGEIAVGEPSVAIATAAPHRAAAYEANRQALERLKAEVPIWKLEQYADGEAAWREEEPLNRPDYGQPLRTGKRHGVLDGREGGALGVDVAAGGAGGGVGDGQDDLGVGQAGGEDPEVVVGGAAVEDLDQDF
jgi:MoaE-MoaD fusion protein